MIAIVKGMSKRLSRSAVKQWNRDQCTSFRSFRWLLRSHFYRYLTSRSFHYWIGRGSDSSIFHINKPGISYLISIALCLGFTLACSCSWVSSTVRYQRAIRETGVINDVNKLCLPPRHHAVKVLPICYMNIYLCTHNFWLKIYIHTIRVILWVGIVSVLQFSGFAILSPVNYML